MSTTAEIRRMVLDTPGLFTRDIARSLGLPTRTAASLLHNLHRRGEVVRLSVGRGTIWGPPGLAGPALVEGPLGVGVRISPLHDGRYVVHGFDGRLHTTPTHEAALALRAEHYPYLTFDDLRHPGICRPRCTRCCGHNRVCTRCARA